MKNKCKGNMISKVFNREISTDKDPSVVIHSNTLEFISERLFKDLLNSPGFKNSQNSTNTLEKEQRNFKSQEPSTVGDIYRELKSNYDGNKEVPEITNNFLTRGNDCSIPSNIPENRNSSKSCNIQKLKNVKGTTKLYGSPNSNSPFRSPTTSSTVNLRSNYVSTKAKGNLVTFPEEMKENLIDETGELENVFLNENDTVNKYRRKSSVLAEINTRKRLEKEAYESKNEEFVKRPIDRLFCGLYKENAASSKSLNLFKPKETNSPLKLGVLMDKTNSPVKSYKNFNYEKTDPEKASSPNPAFFISDDVIQSEDKNAPEAMEKETTISKNYLKIRQVNTKLNEEYTTVVTKRKVIIDLFSCPKSYFRKNNRERKVYFDFDPVLLAHNSNGNINPILIENNNEISFNWTGEKETVEIVKK